MKSDTPTGLGAGGSRLWNAATTAFSFDPAELELLTQASRLTDQLDQLTEALAGAPTMTEGSAGQPRVNPLYDEIRKHSESLAKLVAALRLPTGEAPKSSSDANRDAASARWAKAGRKSS